MHMGAGRTKLSRPFFIVCLGRDETLAAAAELSREKESKTDS